MIHHFTAPQNLALPVSPFSALPSASIGFVLWLLCSAGAIIYAIRAPRSANARWPMLLATGIYTGLFLNLYQLVDEVMINLEHSYNLKHFGKFSMSSTGWVDGTVEMLYYLLHAPFAWSQQSLVISNFAISFAIGWLHLWLVARLFKYDTDPALRTFALCGFALCSPLIVIFSSGFGNGLVSLLFLAAIVAAAEGRTAFSLALSGLFPARCGDGLDRKFGSARVPAIDPAKASGAVAGPRRVDGNLLRLLLAALRTLDPDAGSI
jgi:hypothetical protein